MARIAVGGFQHETNTFAPVMADLDDFMKGGGPLPPLTRGPGILDAVAGSNVPLAGFVDEVRSQGHDLAPLLLGATMPSAHVTTRAFETIAAWMADDLRNAGRVDAIYLDLHGAMVAEHVEDGEGELLRRLRAVAGPDLPIVISLDYHANVTDAMMKLTEGVVAYRTYPHVDRAVTGQRAAHHLLGLLGDHGARFKAFKQVPFLPPLTAQCTEVDPTLSIIRALEKLEGGDVGVMSYAAGFPLADIHDCGPSIFGYGRTQAAADRAVDGLYDEVLAREKDFIASFYSPAEAVAKAKAIAVHAKKPVLLADTQDNPGAGGTADSVEILAALVQGQAPGAVYALINDPEVAARAHDAGEGATLDIALGAKSGYPGAKPLVGSYKVEKVTQGEFTGTGPMYKGIRFRLGKTALLKIGGVHVVVGSSRTQAGDRSVLRHVGLVPEAQKIIALKSSVHFRADYQPISSDILVVVAPGPNIADTRDIPYKRLRRGIRVSPLGMPWPGRVAV